MLSLSDIENAAVEVGFILSGGNIDRPAYLRALAGG
jgi:hypothetical protein